MTFMIWVWLGAMVIFAIVEAMTVGLTSIWFALGALGGFVAATAYMMDMPIFILIVALIYWVEILSVMIQVTYFKISGGKRIFRMAPIHHHFELGGWSETRVVAVFSIVTALLCLVGLLAL